MVDEPAMTKAEREVQRLRSEEMKKNQLQTNVKETLDQQVQMHNFQKQEEQRVNPEQNSYSVIGTMFRNKVSPYDKKQYSEYLKNQAVEQKRRRNEWNHMTDE